MKMEERCRNTSADRYPIYPHELVMFLHGIASKFGWQWPHSPGSSTGWLGSTWQRLPGRGQDDLHHLTQTLSPVHIHRVGESVHLLCFFVAVLCHRTVGCGSYMILTLATTTNRRHGRRPGKLGRVFSTSVHPKLLSNRLRHQFHQE